VTIRITATQPGPAVPVDVGKKPSYTRKTSQGGFERIVLPESTLIVPRGWEAEDLGDLIRLRRRAER
jgi:hypothetical protein